MNLFLKIIIHVMGFTSAAFVGGCLGNAVTRACKAIDREYPKEEKK